MSKGDLTKEHIVAQAAPIFNRSGFAGTSLSELMAATGLQKGGIYRHFKSKEELAAAAFDHAWRRAWNARWSGIDKNAGAIGRLKQFVANFIDNRAELVPGGCPVLNTAVDSDDGNLALRDRARKALTRWIRRIEQIVSAGIASGEIRSNVDPRVAATILVATLEGALMIGRLQRSNLALEQAREYLIGFLEGLANAGRKEAPAVRSSKSLE
ncbi:MAG TPA: TetR/AcrR family transcriptional regulator [Bryobacteraceae bacterium]|nr:TetR/AcrR family transcriptional regulator [Bryobacteraceae bacterium]